MKSSAISLIILFVFILNCVKEPTALRRLSIPWTIVDSGVEEVLYDVDFSDTHNGWIVGNNGLILHSKNGGETWIQQTCPLDEFLMAVDFINSSNGWICSKGSILRTINSGDTWEINHTEDMGEGHFRNIKFVNKNTGFAVGGKGSYGGSTGILLKTVDGGNNWVNVVPDSISTLTSISIVDEQHIWICGFGGTILSSTDIGQTWIKKSLDISPSPSLTTIQFVDDKIGWASSRDDWLGFYRTTDGGDSWIRRSNESLSIFGVQTFYFIDRFEGWLGVFPGAGHAIAKTSDGGVTWDFLEDMGISRIHSFCFLNSKKGWAVGLEGVVLLYQK